jgi:hypothetical protein
MFGQFAEAQYELEHRHNDGTWSRLERVHHDPADHDPERDWANHQLYVCPICAEQIRVRTPDNHGGSERQ